MCHIDFCFSGQRLWMPRGLERTRKKHTSHFNPFNLGSVEQRGIASGLPFLCSARGLFAPRRSNRWESFRRQQATPQQHSSCRWVREVAGMREESSRSTTTLGQTPGQCTSNPRIDKTADDDRELCLQRRWVKLWQLGHGEPHHTLLTWKKH